MITIFSIPKGFEGRSKHIQRNALASWRRLGSHVQIVLFGDDVGVSEAAQEFSAEHVREVSVNAYGTPLVSDAFEKIRHVAKSRLIMYSNADLLYDQSLLRSAEVAAGQEQFLMSGQCWDTVISEDLTSVTPKSWEALFSEHRTRGKLRGPAGMDYFVFPRAMPLVMPQFAVGRVGWDNWLVWHCLMKGVPVINATMSVIAIHQNHDYANLRLGNQHKAGPERDLNTRAAGGLAHMLTLREADWDLADGRLQRRPVFRRLPSILARQRSYQKLLALKRSLWA